MAGEATPAIGPLLAVTQPAEQAGDARVALLGRAARATVLGTGHPGGDVGVLVVNFCRHTNETRNAVGSNRQCQHPFTSTAIPHIRMRAHPHARHWPVTPRTATGGALWLWHCLRSRRGWPWSRLP